MDNLLFTGIGLASINILFIINRILTKKNLRLSSETTLKHIEISEYEKKLQKKLKTQKLFPSKNVLAMIVENFLVIALFSMAEVTQDNLITLMLKFLITFLVYALLITTGRQLSVFLNTTYLKKNPDSMKGKFFQSSSYKNHTILVLNLNITIVLLALLAINPNIYTLGFFVGAVRVMVIYYRYFKKTKEIEN